ncbi:MAG: hypothetical protein K2X48_17390 [Chitinophagaceae bacterium]|nr:hypothetical protein [Chitinophagaceae bacterium]
MEQKRAYRTENLQKIAQSIAVLAKKDPGFRSHVIAEARKKFDGDYNVLVKILMENPSYAASLKTKGLLQGHQAFQQLEGENWEPQIYIPRLAAKEANDNHYQARVTENETLPEPQFLIYDGNEATTVYQGYELNSYNVLTPVPDLLIDSAYAENNEVWVISLNEDPNTATCTPSAEGISSLPLTCTEPVTTGYFQHMKIKDHKESVFAGGSDIHIARVSSWFHPQSRNPFTNEIQGWYTFEKGTEREFQLPQGKVKQCVNEGNGVLMRRFSKREVNRQTNVEINWDYFKDWNGQCRSRQQISYGLDCKSKVNEISGNILYYVIFERDAWPSENFAGIPNPAPGSTQIMDLKYRSEQTAYYWSYFRHSNQGQSGVINNFRNTNVNHPWIEFTSRAK